MTQAAILRPRRARRSSMTSVRIRYAPRPVSGAAAEFPAGSLEEVRAGRSRSITILLAFLIHAGAIGGLFLAAWLAPEMVEKIIPLEHVEDQAEPAPAAAPRVLAERRAVEFNPQAAAVTPQIVNPAIVPQTVPVDAPQVAQIEPVAAPVAIEQTQFLAKRVTQVAPTAAATVPVAIDVPTAPAVRAVQPVIPTGNAGPRQIVSAGESVGSVVSDVQGSAVKEGIASNRDVLGSPHGTTVATINSRVSDGFMIGDGSGGDGPGGTGTGDSDCHDRPEVKAYWAQIRTRMYARWVVPPGSPANQTVKLRFRLDTAGAATEIEVVQSSDNSVGASALAALKAASPFDAMPERVRCLARRRIVATFQLTPSEG
jgi:TonB family protein